MKRAVRWIGIGVTAAAAATMLLADVALADPAGRTEAYTMRFDLLSPGGLDCTADAPGSDVRIGRDLFGKPMIRILGNPRAATIACADAQGHRWQATAQRTARYSPALTTWGTVAYRPGRAATMTLVELGDRVDTQHKTFVRVD